MIRVPNVSRSRAYATAESRAPWARPTATAAIPSRPESRPASAILRPSPSAPRRREASTRTLSKRIVAVAEPVRPILRSGGSAERPSVEAGTRKQEMPLRSSEVRAITL